ncbi:helicase domino-like isoform X3 [Lineus longissimus]|uniref:helicase domino-like isoform X3 n=1 Tax=Lineus longissimus TaxID=88925 RepID=UPI00315D5CA4
MQRDLNDATQIPQQQAPQQQQQPQRVLSGDLSPLALASGLQNPLQQYLLATQVQNVQTIVQQATRPNVLGMVAVPSLSPSRAQPNVLAQQLTATTSSAPLTLPLYQDQLELQIQRSQTFQQGTTTVSATGGTIHHHGQSPTRGIPPLANPQSTKSGQHQTRRGSGNSTSPGVNINRPLFERNSPISSGMSHNTSTSPRHSPGAPRKKIKLEEVPPATSEIGNYRKLILEHKHNDLSEVKENYTEHLTELFFLQNGGNLMDYHQWRKRSPAQLTQFLRSGALDSEEEDGGRETRIYDEVKVITTSGGTTPIATPVAISTTLPPAVTAIQQQTSDPKKPGGRHGMVFGPHQPTQPQQLPQLPGGIPIISSPTTPSASSSFMSSTPQQTLKTPSQSMPIEQTAIGKSLTESLTTPARLLNTPHGTPSHPKSSPKSPLSPNSQRLHSTRQHSISAVYDSAIGSQEAIVERAKQEAQVMQRIAELRKEGLWSTRRLPKVQEPARNKAHWDYLLEEMQWLAADFAQERKWKKAGCRKIARMINRYHQEKQQKELRAEKEEANKTKRIAKTMSKMVEEFWSNIEKVVQYKQQSRLEERRKKAMDLHLSFIVDQTEKYSSWLTENFTGSVASSVISSPGVSAAEDDEFEPEHSESDDEETIEKEEKEMSEADTRTELEELQQDMNVPIEDLLKSLPAEVLKRPASIKSSDDEDMDVDKDKSDAEFSAEEDSDDNEETLDEQEKHETPQSHNKELQDLQAECAMSVDELYKKYSGAYDSDFEFPETPSDSDDETDIDDGDEESDESEEEEEDEPEDADVGMESLFDTIEGETKKMSKKGDDDEGPSSEMTDLAATAESLQPTGYTLETTKVQTKVPFLLKHTLREYQHVGLDWLATMYERRLNGILADEMGLGKTIQTIALLAHLACEKGVWGPHLIVVPTSVMLNWEMEFKKWCPAFKILTYYGSQKERKAKRTGWTKTNAFHVCITSYKLVIQDHQAFRRKKWKYLVLDEAQNIKNFKSQRWQTLLNFSSQRRLLLTGTPLQNHLMELWSLMHFLMPHVFQSHRDFKEWFSNPLSGMVEGSQEYNESIIRRLHKVLRPFLLRRLKVDVEKQMPKKYEHVVMCRLSKRQRFLYDDFMSQTKTKETLATGHFMSVINVLMQLRKVCNHPNLFDPRPTVSPFQMEGITYTTASLVLKALEYEPLKKVDFFSLYPSLADLEVSLPAFAAHRIKKLQAQKPLIVEIDDQPDPPPRPKPIPLKSFLYSRSSSPSVMTGRSSSPFKPVQQRSSSPVVQSPLVRSPAPSTVSQLLSTPTPTTFSTTTVVVPSSINTTQPEQLPGYVGPKTAMTSAPPTSQPITVQIHHTQQGTRLMIPSGQLSQLPAGFIQILQTSMGQMANQAAPLQTVANMTAGTTLSEAATIVSSTPVVNGLPPLATTVTTASSLVTQTRPIPAVQLPTSSSLISSSKPVVRVSPMSSDSSNRGTTAISNSLFSKTFAGSDKPKKSAAEKLREKKMKSPFYMEELMDKQLHKRREVLEFMAKMNKRQTEVRPVYGYDLCHAVNVLNDMSETKVHCNRWKGLGYVHCYNVYHSDHQFWRGTKALTNIVQNPTTYLERLQDITDRYAFVIPPVTAPRITIHASHPPPSFRQHKVLERELEMTLTPASRCLHKIKSKMSVQFPELRLIQYDCGKLQTMDVLLRQLKTGGHKALIFTQMTRMLDVLECFLNYHGHRYLRLDGTTKVEQRQLLMERFNADKRIFCFILSTRSGGLGINLTGADTVIFYDSDWNPTMDAQAQDRCHRIGQTRDVHIYRLISERTIEENILKKANQKRLLGDVAIEGGNFTTAFFRQNTISDIFEEPSGLETFVKEKNEKEKRRDRDKGRREREEREKKKAEEEKERKAKEAVSDLDLEQALCAAEDETDVQAAKTAKAEEKAELAEFDETIPWDEKEAERRQEEEEVSKVEMELAQLQKELSPIERYALLYIEDQLAPYTNEELQEAEEEVENAKKDWELGRLKALKEEEERRAAIEEDEMLFTYTRDDAYNQYFISDNTGEHMPMWAPPTPPQDDNDMYIDHSIGFLFETTAMPESQLPAIYVKKENKKIRLDPTAIGKCHKARKHKVRKEEQPRVPRSLFDRPTAALLKMRREAKLQKVRQGLIHKPLKSLPILNKPITDTSQDQPEWLIHEDWALLQAVQTLLELPLNLTVVSPAHIPNWDLVADVVNAASRIYRSAKQCKNRYEGIVVPREEGKILYDINPRKQKKSKGLYKVLTKNNRPMRTSQLFHQDNNGSITTLHTMRFDAAKSIAAKRVPTLRPTLVSPTQKNPKHAAVLAESGVIYDTPLTPIQVAANRAERIAKEKKATAEQQLAAQRAAAQKTTQVVTTVAGQLQPVVTATATTVMQTGTLPKIGTGGVTAVSLARNLTGASSIVVNTAGGVPGTSFANINKRISQTAVVGQTGTTVSATLTPTVRVRTAGAMTVQDITANQAQLQARAALQTSSATVITTTMTAAQLAAQRMPVSTVASSAIKTVSQRTGTVQQLTQATAKSLTPAVAAQIQLFRQQALKHQQQQQLRAQQQRLQGVAVTGVSAEQLKRLQAQQAVTQGTVTSIQKAAGTPLLTGVTTSTVTASQRLQAQKAAGLQAVPRMTESEVAAFLNKNKQLQTQVKPGTVTTATGLQVTQAQITQGQIMAQVQQVAQSGATSQPVATLVKTVPNPTTLSSVTLPVSSMSTVSVGGLNISVSMPQQKTGAVKAATISQQQQLQRQLQFHQIQQQRKLHQQKVTALGQPQAVGKAQIPGPNTIQIMQQQQKTFTMQQIQQLVKQQQQQGHAQTIQQIITSMSPAHTSGTTVIVTQAPQTVTKLSVPNVTVQQVRPTAQVTLGTPLTSVPSQTVLTSSALTVVSSGATTLPTQSHIKLTDQIVITQAKPVVTTPAPVASATIHVAGASELAAKSPAVLHTLQQPTLQAPTTPTAATVHTTVETTPIILQSAPPAVSQVETVQTSVVSKQQQPLQSPGAGQQQQAKTTPYTMRLRNNPPKQN